MAFQEYVFQNNEFSNNFNRTKPSTDHWMNFTIGSSAYHLAVNQLRKRNELNVELYISDDKSIFNTLHNHKEKVEREMDMELEWLELPNKKASRILAKTNVDFDDSNQWNEQFKWLIDVMLKMKKTVKKYI